MGFDLRVMTSKFVFFSFSADTDTQPRKIGPGGQAVPPPGKSQEWPQRSQTLSAAHPGDTELQTGAKLSTRDGPEKGVTGECPRGALGMAGEDRGHTAERVWKAGR